MVRRSLTIKTDVDMGVQQYRASILQKGKDIDYTEAVNELLKEVLKQKGFVSV